MTVLEEIKTIKQENLELKQRVQLLESKLDKLEIKERESNIIIAGVPKQPNSNPRQIVSEILTAMDLEIQKDKIVECFRMNKEDRAPMLVTFSKVQIKKDVLKKIKELKGITLGKCELDGDKKNKIYLNEDLPLSKRDLFKKTREHRKVKGYKAAFYVNGVIYLKKTEHDTPIKIYSENDLNSKHYSCCNKIEYVIKSIFKIHRTK